MDECHQKANRAAVEQHKATKKSKKTTTPIKIFKTAQSLGKAKSRVKNFVHYHLVIKRNFFVL